MGTWGMGAARLQCQLRAQRPGDPGTALADVGCEFFLPYWNRNVMSFLPFTHLLLPETYFVE